VLLPDDISEPLRAILAGYDLIGHGGNLRLTIYDLRAKCDGSSNCFKSSIVNPKS
jgi:hypothetical protein